MSAANTPLFDKCQRYTSRYSTRSTCTIIYTYNACLRTHFRDTYIPTILRFSFGSCRFRRNIYIYIYIYIRFACLLVCLSPKKKRPHASGTHVTRRNIAVAIPLAFNKRLQQHMRSTTFGPSPSVQLERLQGVLLAFNATDFQIAIGI